MLISFLQDTTSQRPRDNRMVSWNRKRHEASFPTALPQNKPNQGKLVKICLAAKTGTGGICSILSSRTKTPIKSHKKHVNNCK